MLKKYLLRLFTASMDRNKRNILEFVRGSRPEAFLDLGCDDGAWTMQIAGAANAKSVSGIELVEQRAEQARARAITVSVADLDGRFDFPDNHFDLIHSNQVIEHVADIDNFAAEIMWVLKPGGLAVVSTENGSSWHNIAAAIMGWQIFSSTNLSKLSAGLGNPLSLMRSQQIELSTWTHKTIFNYRGLKEFFGLHGFEQIRIKGAGYHPLPPILGVIDPRHSHWITIAARKPAAPRALSSTSA